ncbi:hypothetical protein KTN05_16000 [Paracoccus sp. Z118]|nr:hypothetical protein [Paracoccus sp. Z118]MBV0893315.1 hypothetical protein [Paracoccus sp. Z118]
MVLRVGWYSETHNKSENGDRATAANQGARVPRPDDRDALNGIFWRLRTGARRADIPAATGRTRLATTAGAGRVTGRILEAISDAHDGDVQMIDSSSIRVHQHAANG